MTRAIEASQALGIDVEQLSEPFAMVEELEHPEFDYAFDALWVSLPDPN